VEYSDQQNLINNNNNNSNNNNKKRCKNNKSPSFAWGLNKKTTPPPTPDT
jgi:hypothetical protein